MQLSYELEDNMNIEDQYDADEPESCCRKCNKFLENSHVILATLGSEIKFEN